MVKEITAGSDLNDDDKGVVKPKLIDMRLLDHTSHEIVSVMADVEVFTKADVDKMIETCMFKIWKEIKAWSC